MKKLLLGSAVLFLFAISIFIFQISCKKDAGAQTNVSGQTVSDAAATAKVCDVRGVYAGTSTSSGGVTSSTVYRLQDNNFAVSSSTIESNNVTFGGYRNTCDSVFISVYYTGNSSYYLLKGKFKNYKTVINGTFQNLTIPSDYGTFTLTKQ